MRKVLFTTLLGIALATVGCKKENKDAAAAGSAAGEAVAAAGEAAKMAGEAAGAAGEAAKMAGEAAAAAAAAVPSEDPGPRPASLTDEDVAIFDKMVGSIETMTKSIEAAGSECPKVAEAIKAISNDVNAIAEQGKKLDEKMQADEAAKSWFEKTYAPRFMGAFQSFQANPCARDAAVLEAMATLKMN
ncbi:MAG: hypothetical protein R3B48_27940 [Kofleriaceae bacterium]